MENYQNTLLAEQLASERHERLVRAADEWYLHGDPPQEPAVRERLAELLIAVAVWLAPERSAVSRQPSAVSDQRSAVLTIGHN